MKKIRAYYEKGIGYKLYMPDGTEVPFLTGVSIHDEWVDAGSKCGGSSMVPSGIVSATVTLYIEVINEPPMKS